jgi:hypothetical protein
VIKATGTTLKVNKINFAYYIGGFMDAVRKAKAVKTRLIKQILVEKKAHRNTMSA